jgi:hypothetical protein
MDEEEGPVHGLLHGFWVGAFCYLAMVRALLAAFLLLPASLARSAELQAVDKLGVRGHAEVEQGLIVSTKSGSTPVLFISSTIQPGNVGVGTTNPTGMLQVGGGTLTVKSDGTVGIGTLTPGAALDVNGTVKSTATESSSAAFIHAYLLQCGGGPCASYHTLNQWTDVSAQNYNWVTAANNSPATYAHNDHGRITLLKTGTYWIRLYAIFQPTADSGHIASVCPSLNGSADCSPSWSSNGIKYCYYKAAFWARMGGPYDFIRTLGAGTTVGWAYYPYQALNDWAHDYYTAIEIIRLN